MAILQTERTDLDLITIEDAPFFVELVNSPDWLRYIGANDVHDVSSARAYLERAFLSSYAQHGFGYYAVRLHSGPLIGICGFLQKPYLKHPDFGFALLPAYYRQGYGFEVAAATLSYGMQAFSLSVVDAVAHRSNTSSIRLLAKLSFAEIGEVEVPKSRPDDRFRLFRHSA